MKQMMTLVGMAQIRAAAANLVGVAVRTPLLPSPWSPQLWLKPESLQPTGAFKLRGAYHAVAALPALVRAPGVVTHSSGNHGQALAYAAGRFGVPCVVVMPEQAGEHKIAATSRLGAEVVLVPAADRLSRTAAIAAERGMTLVPPFDHLDVIAGQGTVGLEIAEDLPAQDQLETVLVPVGGGGLAAGVATAIKDSHPDVRVIGVEPALAADARESLAARELRQWPVAHTYQTVADGLRTHLSELTLAHLVARLDGIVTVTETEIIDAAGALLREARLVVEPSGAVAVAAYRSGAVSGRTVAVISGGNLEPGLLARLARG